ncbi:MAG: amidohydrolase [Rhodocyclaceae bacterium]|nr:amidohydrolase [Rhodocyclaceae bacterium]MBX3668402.1 amidohydrolase [Rhodocyclaceae bacterium]
MKLAQQLQGIQEKFVHIRRDIHAHPETAFEEHRTASLVADHLRALGLEVHTGLGRTGLVGVLRNGSSTRGVGLRADMDALPIEERNTFAHRSRHAGKMHACGHDGHVAMLLAAAEVLAGAADFDGSVYFIFQPAEEGRGGAAEMIRDGLFERFPMQAVFGLHNWPGLPVGKFAVRAGPMMASSDEFEIIVSGKGGHAAMPHQAADPIVAGSAIVQALQTLVSRNVPPVEAGVVSVTQFHAGDAYNVIAPSARLCGTARAFSQEVRDLLEHGLTRVATGLASGLGTTATVNYRHGYPPTINTPDEAAFSAAVAREVLGVGQVLQDLPPTMGSEDFAFMLQVKPGAYVWLGNGEGEGGCMLHSPVFDFNDQIIPLGVAYWVRLAQTYLARQG